MVNASEEERRYFALHCGEENIQDHAFFGAMDDQMRNGGLEALMYELSEYKPAGGWDMLRKAPITPYLRVQQSLSRRPLDQFFLELIREEGYDVEGGASIALQERRATEVPLLDLRTVVADFMRHVPLHKREKAGYPEIRAAARRMIGAYELMRPNPGRMNRSSVLVIPPLLDAREYATRHHGATFDLPSEADRGDDAHVIAIDVKNG